MKIKIDKEKWMTAAMYGVLSTLLLLAAANASMGKWLTAFCNVIWCGTGYINILLCKRLSRANRRIIELLELSDKMLQTIKALRSNFLVRVAQEVDNVVKRENDGQQGDKGDN